MKSLIIFYAELSDCNTKFTGSLLRRSVLKRNISSLSIPSSYEKNIRRTNVSNEIPKVCSMRGTSLAHVIREIKGKHFIVNVSREFNSPESFQRVSSHLESYCKIHFAVTWNHAIAIYFQTGRLSFSAFIVTNINNFYFFFLISDFTKTRVDKSIYRYFN